MRSLNISDFIISYILSCRSILFVVNVRVYTIIYKYYILFDKNITFKCPEMYVIGTKLFL